MKPSPGIRAIVCSVMTVRVLSARPAVAGPPFITDDPVPVDYRHSEFYIFSTQDKARDGKNSAFPAFEFNYGVPPTRNCILSSRLPEARRMTRLRRRE